MSELIGQIGSWYASLQEQEKRILLFGTPIILMLVLYLLLFQPLGSAYFSRQSEIADRREDLAWVRDQRSILERVNTSCDFRTPVFPVEEYEAEVEATARRFGLNPVISSHRGGTGFELQFTAADGNRVLSLVRALSCGGIKVTALQMQQLEIESNELAASLNLEHAGAGD
ncbi:MAG: hypothetical protein HOL48_06950 [Porticoccaceae bacterium]|jgi:type II secretory pathway component PulM|nr:hypothetical protein [Porticoccaceae bacterium]